ncbi:flagellar hook-length control protein FliK [Mariniblastus fucicola]|uniref:Flagellar hook-length control protein FliK n=1 Tax=Mariniblastus fucicola TaxID=980251 RepID=A0A5B9PDZ6_9BACT|nr:flagellar hook-length control protein FliK [Mariniblastus fucicola]QEG23360.1 Flagellar hook-length control protein FliK [Mariniblastus fucicola]
MNSFPANLFVGANTTVAETESGLGEDDVAAPISFESILAELELSNGTSADAAAERGDEDGDLPPESGFFSQALQFSDLLASPGTDSELSVTGGTQGTSTDATTRVVDAETTATTDQSDESNPPENAATGETADAELLDQPEIEPSTNDEMQQNTDELGATALEEGDQQLADSSQQQTQTAAAQSTGTTEATNDSSSPQDYAAIAVAQQEARVASEDAESTSTDQGVTANAIGSDDESDANLEQNSNSERQANADAQPLNGDQSNPSLHDPGNPNTRFDARSLPEDSVDPTTSVGPSDHSAGIDLTPGTLPSGAEVGMLTDRATTINEASTIAKFAPEIRTSYAVASQASQAIQTKFASFKDEASQTISLTLHPAELGQLQITIEQTSDQMVAQITASDFNSTEMLLQEKDFLLESLSELGFGETSLDISHGGSDQEPMNDEQDTNSSPSFTATETAADTPTVVHTQTTGVNFVA